MGKEAVTELESREERANSLASPFLMSTPHLFCLSCLTVREIKAVPLWGPNSCLHISGVTRWLSPRVRCQRAGEPGTVSTFGQNSLVVSTMLPWPQWASLVTHKVKNLLAVQETEVRSIGREDPLEKGMATHSSVLAWRIPWTEEPGELQAMGSQRVRHD